MKSFTYIYTVIRDASGRVVSQPQVIGRVVRQPQTPTLSRCYKRFEFVSTLIMLTIQDTTKK